jgi:predicted RNA binding protein YcfA (HicA-like mRNA interferase family)
VGLYLWLSYRHDAARRAALASHAGEDVPPGA